MMEQVLLLSVVTASFSFTLTDIKLFLSFRKWVEQRSNFFGKLLGCGYCSGHWIAFIMVAIYRPRLFEAYWLLDYFLTAGDSLAFRYSMDSYVLADGNNREVKNLKFPQPGANLSTMNGVIVRFVPKVIPTLEIYYNRIKLEEEKNANIWRTIKK